MRVFGLSIVTGLLFASASLAQVATGPMFTLQKKHSRQLYVMAETTGGSDSEWSDWEDAARKAVRLELATGQNDLGLVDDKGNTVLHLAAAKGFLFVVEELLKSAQVRTTLQQRNEANLSAFDVASLATAQTLKACHPEMENPFALVPYLVQHPYYQSRQPFEKIQKALVHAGADSDQAAARQHWLDACTNTDPRTRLKVESADNLTAVLLEIAQDVQEQSIRREVDENVKFFLHLIEDMPERLRPSPEELKRQIAKLYTDKGLLPPE